MTKNSGVFTKLHEAEAILARGRSESPGYRVEVVRGMIEECSRVPHYVMDAMLVYRLDREAVVKSMDAMAEAGVLRLPYPTVFMELWAGMPDTRLFMLAKDAGNGCFKVTVLPWVYETKKQWLGDPVDVFITRTNKPPPGSQLYFGELGGELVPGKPADPNEDLSGFTFAYARDRELDTKVVMQILLALAVCVMMRHIKGLETEEIETHRLNKQRVLSGKTRIPDHTVVRIGHVYTKSGTKTSARDATGRTMPIHMRAAHVRRQYHTTHWLEQEKKQPGDPGVFEDHHLVLIDAVLVNFKDGTDLAKPLPKLVKL